jgi:hypothetical protein
MNRGNHEDYAICVGYGFQLECIEKYDELTFGMFIEVFQVYFCCLLLSKCSFLFTELKNVFFRFAVYVWHIFNQQLPLFAIINNTVIVIHGGLFHCNNPTITELNEIDRTKFTLQVFSNYTY